MNISKRQLNKFLDTKSFFKLNKDIKNLPTSSWLFVTYNRCPFSDPEKNPLTWSFQTLINNKLYKIDDYVVIDDNSSDYTKKTIDWIKKHYGINIKYIKNNKRLSCSSSRKIGLKHLNHDLVFMGDDDCLYSEYFLFGSILTYYFLKIKKPKEKIAVINFPVYEKDLYPSETVRLKNIGKVLLEKTFFYHEFDKFPLEYLASPRYFDESQTLLEAIKVDTFKGVNLSDRRLILKAGNYTDLYMWPSSYSEHIELSYKLQKHGFSMYHQTDPRVSCIHLKYGGKTRDRFDRRLSKKKFEGLRYDLGEMVDLAERKRKDTGGRLSVEDFHVVEIGSFFSFYLKISESMAMKFVKNQYKMFVEEAKVFSTTPSTKIKSKDERRRVFILGIKKGIDASKMQTGKDYSSILTKIKKELEIA